MTTSPVTYSYFAFDGQNRIERSGLTAEAMRSQVSNLQACFYRVTVLATDGSLVTV